MRPRIVPLLLPVLVTAACAADFDDSADHTDEETQSANGPIFPDDPPRESCDLNTPLVCPNTLWTVTYATAQFTGATATQTFSRFNNAGFSASGAGNETCTASGDFIATGVLNWRGSVQLPAGITYVVSSDRKGLQFVRTSDGRPTGIPRPGGFGPLCGVSCDSTQERLHDGDTLCTPAPTAEAAHQFATVVGGGRTRSVRLDGSVDQVNFDSTTQEVTLLCKMTLPKAQMNTTLARRPNDVITFSSNTFQRGYQFTGQALRDKCTTYGGLVCVIPPGGGNIQQCILDNRDKCISDFSQPDPCIRGPIEQPR